MTGSGPASLTLVPERTALLVIDMQNDFCHPGGYYNTAGGRPSAPIARAVEPIGRLAAAARRAGVTVAYTRFVYRVPGDLTAGHDVHPAGWSGYGERLRAGAWGAEIVGSLAPEPGERVIDKSGYSAFHGTDLEPWLRERGIGCVILSGTVTYACVLHTAFDAFSRGFDVVLVRDAVSSWFDDLGTAATRIVDLLLGVTVGSETVIAALPGGGLTAGAG